MMRILGEARDDGASHRSRSRLTVCSVHEACWTTGLNRLYCRGRHPQHDGIFVHS